MRPQTADLHAAINDIVESVLGVEVSDYDVNLIGLGASSMELIRIINRLEDDLGFRPEFEQLIGSPTVAALAAAFVASGTQTASAAASETAEPATEKATQSDFASLPADTSAELPSQRPNQAEEAAFISGVRRVSGYRALELHSDRSRAAPLALRSTRYFDDTPVTASAFAELISVLDVRGSGEQARADYASASARFPVQVYWYFKNGRVENVAAGLYYYHPVERSLILLEPEIVIEPDVYEPIVNAPMFERAGFAVYLVSRPRAVESLYRGRARDYCLLEAGAMAQLLRQSAAVAGVGLCQIGEVKFSELHTWLDLESGQECLHSLVGGVAADANDHGTESGALLQGG